MRQVGIDNIEPGMVNARNVYPAGEAAGVPLLAANVMVTQAILRSLRRAGVTVLMIDDELSRGIESVPPLSDETRRRAVSVLRGTWSAIEADEGRLARAHVEQVENVVARVLAELSQRRGLLTCLGDLDLFGGGRLQHAMQVCVVGSAIAQEFFRSHGWKDFRGARRADGIEDRMVKLGVGLLMHDIGMLSVPESLRDQHLLSGQQRTLVQHHPTAAIALLDDGELSPLTRVTITQHHERFDGSGYPRGLAGDDLHDHGQIAAVADAYVTMCEPEEVGGAGFESHEAYSTVMRASGRLFRREVVEAFVAGVAPYGPGTTVRLSDGRHAIVAANTPGSPLAPVVRVTHDAQGERLDPPEQLDLRAVAGAVSIEGATDGLPGDGTQGVQRRR